MGRAAHTTAPRAALHRRTPSARRNLSPSSSSSGTAGSRTCSPSATEGVAASPFAFLRGARRSWPPTSPRRRYSDCACRPSATRTSPTSGCSPPRNAGCSSTSTTSTSPAGPVGVGRQAPRGQRRRRGGRERRGGGCLGGGSPQSRGLPRLDACGRRQPHPRHLVRTSSTSRTSRQSAVKRRAAVASRSSCARSVAAAPTGGGQARRGRRRGAALQEPAAARGAASRPGRGGRRRARPRGDHGRLPCLSQQPRPRAAPAARPLPRGRHRPQGGGRGERRHALLHRSAGRPRRGRPAGPSVQGGGPLCA